MRNAILLVVGLILAACGGGGGNGSTQPQPGPEPTATFEISVTNLTNAQPLSPPLAVLHQGAYRIFALGEPASVGLEQLAESGDNAELRVEAGNAEDALAVSTFSGVIPPGASGQVSITLSETDLDGLTLSLATMLVNTNDAFSGVNALAGIGSLAVGGSHVVRAIAYDAGTEADTEGPGTIPGPAGGGEGFDVQRNDDADRVSMHPGVVTVDAGLATSVLTGEHRFDNPVLEIRVARVN